MDIITMDIARYNYKIDNSNREIVNLRNGGTDLLAPLMKTSNGQKEFSFRGSKVWNELEHEVKLAPSLSTFKYRLSRT